MTIDLGPVGVWAPLRLWINEGPSAADAAAELEDLGLRAIWLGNGSDWSRVVSTLLGATGRVRVAPGVLNVWAHALEPTAAAYTAIAQRHPGRSLLGLGNGWKRDWPGAPTPYALINSYLDGLDAFDPPVPRGERILGALGPRMLALAAKRSLGAHPFLTTPEHTRVAREILGAGPLLVPEQKVVLEPDPVKAREIARGALDFYLTKPNYAASIRRLGFGEDDFADGGSDRLVDALVAWGDMDAVLERIAEHHQAGADHVAVQVLTGQSDFGTAEQRRLPRREYRELARALYSPTPRDLHHTGG